MSPQPIRPRTSQFMLETCTILPTARPGEVAMPLQPTGRPSAPTGAVYAQPTDSAGLSTIANAGVTPAADDGENDDDDIGGDIYEGRTDVVGFAEKPRIFFLPFWKKLEVVHPKSKAGSEEENVVVLDLDDIATTGSGTSGGSALFANLLLGGAAFAAFYFGTRTAVKELFGETKELARLADEKSAILKTARDTHGAPLSTVATRRLQENFAALILENDRNRVDSHMQRIFTGGFSGVAATTMGTGAIFEMPLWASVPAMAAVGGTLVMVAAPFMSTFGAGAATQEALEIYKTFPMKAALPQITETTPVGNEEAVQELLRKRLNTIRAVSSARCASLLGLAVGAPMTVFGGGFGLFLLMPSVGAMIIAGYVEGKKVTYGPQLTWQDKLSIDGKPALINSIDAAHRDYALIKKLKSEKRWLFPLGVESPQPVKAAIRSFAWVGRKLGGGQDYPTAEETFYVFLGEQLLQDMQSIENTRRMVAYERAQLWQECPNQAGWDDDAWRRATELDEKDAACDANMAELALEQRLLADMLACQPLPDQGVFSLLRYFIRIDLLRPLAEAIVKEHRLKKQLEACDVLQDDGAEIHLDANKLVLLLTTDGPLDPQARLAMARKVFELGQYTLFTTGKNRAHWRERQLLDFLGARLVADCDNPELLQAQMCDPEPTASTTPPPWANSPAPGLNQPSALSRLDCRVTTPLPSAPAASWIATEMPLRISALAALRDGGQTKVGA